MFQLAVRDVSRARRFYEDVLNLRIERESRAMVQFHGGLRLVSSSSAEQSHPDVAHKPIISVTVLSIATAVENIRKLGLEITAPPATKDGRLSFACADSDGYVIEFLEQP